MCVRQPMSSTCHWLCRYSREDCKVMKDFTKILKQVLETSQCLNPFRQPSRVSNLIFSEDLRKSEVWGTWTVPLWQLWRGGVLVSSKRQCHKSGVTWAHWNWPHSSLCPGCQTKSIRFTLSSDGVLSYFGLIFLGYSVISPCGDRNDLCHCTIYAWTFLLIYS